MSARTQTRSGLRADPAAAARKQAGGMSSHDTNTTGPKNTSAFFAQAAISFGTALLTMLCAIYFVPADGWIKAFLALGTLFLTTSCFTLAKVIRDQQESSSVVHRLDQARVEKILAEHDPFRQIS
jgi:hypothetical protein